MKYTKNDFTEYEVGRRNGMLNTIGSSIKEHLTNRGITQTFICIKTKIPNNIMSPMLNGKRKISAEEYFLICEALHVPLDTFAKVIKVS
jgi:transcriptional regulator with XRE-family HTH domain